MTVSSRPWWKDANIYQVYPASFQDSNGDGIGDLPGLLSRIDYIKDTGANTLWICPMYDSPQRDMGYDISDYEKVYPPYGTVEDMEAIILACHERGMKIILDLVINHTSDEHAWFKESRSSKDSPKRSWYMWRPARYDEYGNRRPPNNWASVFGGSAWTWDEVTEEYYLHCFAPEQPDLNWENPETRAAIYETSMHFWLQKGIDGFRVNVVNLYSKVPGLPDAPVTDPTAEFHLPMDQVCNGPRIHEFLGEMHEVMSRYSAQMTVGELPNTHAREHVVSYVSATAKQLSMVFQFDVVNVGIPEPRGQGRFDTVVGENWKLPDLTAAVASTQALLDGSDGWVTTFLENHDQARSISRWASDATEENRVRSAKMLATLQATLSGTLFLYQGQEIGMVNAPKDWTMDEYRDVASINRHQMTRAKTGDDPEPLSRMMSALQHLARDNGRIPMSWDATSNAGFTTSDTPWMRVHDNYKLVNAQRQIGDEGSVLSFWKRILGVRKAYSNALVDGIYRPVQDKDLNVYVYEKHGSLVKVLVALNFSDSEQELVTPDWVHDASAELIVATYDDVVDGRLRPFEGRVWSLSME